MIDYDSAKQLPRFVASNLIKILEPAHVKFGSIDVYLTPNGGAEIRGKLGLMENERQRLIPQDTWAGLIDFLASARLEDDVIKDNDENVVSVGMDTLAYLYAQRVLGQTDLHNEVGFLEPVEKDVWDLHLASCEKREVKMTLRFSPKWNTVRAGLRDPHETDEI